MPNWTLSTMTITGEKEKITELLDLIKSPESDFDFENIIPMPQELNVVSGYVTEIALRWAQTERATLPIVYSHPSAEQAGLLVIRDLDELKDKVAALVKTKQYTESELYELGKQYLENIRKFNAASWYEWCNANWGVKWSASDVVVRNAGEEADIEFATPWSFPTPIINVLAKKFPELSFECRIDYEDSDDIVYNVYERGLLAEVWTEPKDEDYWEEQECEVD